MTAPSRVEAHRFHDGGVWAEDGRPEQAPDPAADPQIVLERHSEDGVESFGMRRRIAYRDREVGQVLVPAGPDFRTDLTSVPWLFTWLVPKTGAHLPAALLHDGLVADRDGSGSSYVADRRIPRDEADRILRDAMADTGTGPIRRWLVWSAVATATIFVGSADWSRARWTAYRLAAALTIGVVLVLGTLATFDLFDAFGVALPWMGHRVWWQEVVGGFAGAVTIPFVLGLAWGRFRVAGAVLGVLLAVLLHVSLALLLLTGVYQGLEWLARRLPGVMMAMVGVVVAASVLVLAVFVL